MLRFVVSVWAISMVFTGLSSQPFFERNVLLGIVLFVMALAEQND